MAVPYCQCNLEVEHRRVERDGVIVPYFTSNANTVRCVTNKSMMGWNRVCVMIRVTGML